MIRRIFPELIAHNVCGVQPMPTPTSLAFALRYRAVQPYAGVTSTNPNELGYNNIDPTYSGSYVTSTAEGLGSNSTAGIYNGLGIGTGDSINEVNLTMEKQQVIAQSRKLRSRWSNEVAQDLRAMHGIDIEREMMDILAYEITQEIDREIIAKMRAVSADNPNSNVATPLDWNDTTLFDGRWGGEKYRSLYNMIIRDANKIAISTRRGPGNFVVADPIVCAALEATSSFTIAPVRNDIDTAVFGVARVGSLDGRLVLYRDTFYTAGQAYTVGFKGNTIFDAGIIYCPYVQLQFAKAVHPDGFTPTIGVMTRYGLLDNLFGAANYYLTTNIENMYTVGGSTTTEPPSA
jgi:hypothetical protein